MKMTKYLLTVLAITFFAMSCQNASETTTKTNDKDVIPNGMYYFLEVTNDEDDLEKRELILKVDNDNVTGKFISWGNYSDKDIITLADLVMFDTEIRGSLSLDRTNLRLEYKHSDPIADDPNVFIDPDNWSWKNDELKNITDGYTMKKVNQKDLNSIVYRKLKQHKSAN